MPRHSFAAVGAAATLAAIVTEAGGHGPDGSWAYPKACCRGDAQQGDCAKIPKQSVRESRSGYVVTLRPGDHRAVTRPHLFVVPYGKAITSGDGNYHACLYPDEFYLNCFFAPGGQI